MSQAGQQHLLASPTRAVLEAAVAHQVGEGVRVKAADDAGALRVAGGVVAHRGGELVERSAGRNLTDVGDEVRLPANSCGIEVGLGPRRDGQKKTGWVVPKRGEDAHFDYRWHCRRQVFSASRYGRDLKAPTGLLIEADERLAVDVVARRRGQIPPAGGEEAELDRGGEVKRESDLAQVVLAAESAGAASRTFLHWPATRAAQQNAGDGDNDEQLYQGESRERDMKAPRGRSG